MAAPKVSEGFENLKRSPIAETLMAWGMGCGAGCASFFVVVLLCLIASFSVAMGVGGTELAMRAGVGWGGATGLLAGSVVSVGVVFLAVGAAQRRG